MSASWRGRWNKEDEDVGTWFAFKCVDEWLPQKLLYSKDRRPLLHIHINEKRKMM